MRQTEAKQVHGRDTHALPALQAAYRKHVQGDDSVGWEELSALLRDALCEVMGDEGFQAWVQEGSHG